MQAVCIYIYIYIYILLYVRDPLHTVTLYRACLRSVYQMDGEHRTVRILLSPWRLVWSHETATLRYYISYTLLEVSFKKDSGLRFSLPIRSL